VIGHGSSRPDQWSEEVREEYWRRIGAVDDLSPGGVPHVLFRLGVENFAVDASFCKGVVRKGPVVPLPGTPRFVLGVAGIRGEALSVTDPRVLLGLPVCACAGKGLFLIVGAGGCKSALWVDWVDDVIAVDPMRIVAGQRAVPRSADGVVLGSWPQISPPAAVIDGRRYLEVTAVRRDREET
jgi:chemotaxis signal transduction protein